MDSLTPVAPVHYYDRHAQGIACGRRGFDQRSTKHVRSVTCTACLGVLRDEPSDAGHGRTGAHEGNSAAAP